MESTHWAPLLSPVLVLVASRAGILALTEPPGIVWLALGMLLGAPWDRWWDPLCTDEDTHETQLTCWWIGDSSLSPRLPQRSCAHRSLC